MYSLHSPITSALLSQNIFFSILFSKILSLCSSLNGTDQVSHTYKNRQIIVLYLLNFIFLGERYLRQNLSKFISTGYGWPGHVHGPNGWSDNKRLFNYTEPSNAPK
jgi:hypothetical protein